MSVVGGFVVVASPVLAGGSRVIFVVHTAEADFVGQIMGEGREYRRLGVWSVVGSKG